MKGKITLFGMIAISLLFILLCGAYWLGTQHREAVIAKSDVQALGLAPVVEEKVPEPDVVDLNSASAEDLMTLPGIGEKLANAIVSFRAEHGEFHSVWELIAVEGIGEGKLEKMIPYLKIE